MVSVLILTLAGTWHPDKTTSSSKNLVLAVTLELSLERKKKGRCCQTWYYLRKFGWRTCSYSCFDFRPIGDITLYKHFFLLCYERNCTLGARDFSCAVSGFSQVLKSDPREKFFLAASPLVSSTEGWRRVGLLPTKLPVTREKKISGTKGRETEESYHKQQLERIHCEFIVYIFSH